MKKIELRVNKSLSSPIIVSSESSLNLASFFNLEKYSKIIVLTDQNVAGFWLAEVAKSLSKTNLEINSIVLTPGEINKNLESVLQIWKELTRIKVDRQSLLICLGGGVVGDLGGFAASCYLRGIDFLQVPTTIVAQVDSAIGGKTGFDFEDQKNNIGSFSLPIGVVIDPLLLKTLPEREYNQGFGEVLKYGLISDNKFWQEIVNTPKDKSFKPKDIQTNLLLSIIAKCAKIKANITATDFEETSGKRKLLNFGHTFGHAVEMLSLNADVQLFHGEAVAIGIHFEAFLSQKLGFLKEHELKQIADTLHAWKLPVTAKFLKAEDIDKILDKIQQDKKTSKGVVKWTLLKKLGQGVSDQIVDDKLLKSAILEFLRY
ncbi:MAG: 3-dehydroquinate synthase [bacterium]